jgi:hypothetical protein
MTKALDDVIAERNRQIEVEGWTPEHDDAHGERQIAVAAGCYAMFSGAYPNAGEPPHYWPWNECWWKPKEYRRDLVRAAALIIAEVERVDRAARRQCIECLEPGKTPCRPGHCAAQYKE